MIKPTKPANEVERLQELLSLEILDTESETAFDEAVELASYITGCPISLISLIDRDRQWFKAKVGLEATETPRDISFCGHAILGDNLFEIQKPTQDKRFHDNPLVTGDLGIRFYAGQPIVTSNGFRIGTLCTIDREQRTLTDEQRRHLATIAKQVSGLIDLRLMNRRQQLKSLTQTQFLSNVSSEIRTPLTGIMGFTSIARETLKREGPNPTVDSALATIDRHSKHILSIIHNVLDLANLESKQSTLDLAAFSPNDIRKHLETLFTPEAEKRGLRFSVAVAPEVPQHMLGDITRLNQVATNLVDNAMKFTSQGEVEVVLSYLNDQLRLSVRDTGLGMTEEQSTRIFRPFMHAEPSIGVKYGGTGLGLAMSKQMAEAMGGEVTLQTSTLNKGSTFLLSVPAVRAQAPEAAADAEKKIGAISRTLSAIGGMAQVLVVDHSSNTRASFKRILQAFAMTADEAVSGKDALDAIARKQYDVIFIDPEMQDIDGANVLKKIRAMRTIPKVVALSPSASENAKLKSIGFDSVIAKPFTPSTIGTALFETLVYT